MPHPHNREEWDSRRDKYNADWKEKQQSKKKNKDEDDDAGSP